MIKWSSIAVAILLALLLLVGIAQAFLNEWHSGNMVFTLLAALSLGAGILLIVSLIIDRYKSARAEGDDYKQY